jgi:hypothetical protein
MPKALRSDREETKNPRAMPEGPEPINIPMAVDGRSCWRWHLGPNVPGVGWLVLLGHLRRCKRSVDGSDVQVSVRTDDLPTVG